MTRTPRPSRFPIQAMRLSLALFALAAAAATAGCDAARQIPGEARYLGQSAADWGAEVIGLPPEEY